MRVLTAAQKTALEASHVRMCYLVEVDLPTGIVRFTTNSSSLFYNGFDWLGAGAMLEIKMPEEDATLEVHNAEVSLNGLDVALISMALNENLTNRRVSISVLLFDTVFYQPIGNACLVMRGTMSNIRITPPSSGS